MADKEKDKKINPPKLPKTNYQTWLILALIVVIFGISRIMNSGELTEILDSRFEEMVRSRDIKKLVLIKNDEVVEITLKPEALQNAKYKQEIEKNSSPLGFNANGPH
ncbi:MAG: peptidase M41, partial [Cytophagales bacterium]|nr:peptidase M41 [Cytophagales bacterium]